MLQPLTNLELDAIENLIETPPNPNMGDFAFPCFQLSKTLRKAPNMIATDLSVEISNVLDETFEKVENLGPYLNFYINKAEFIKATINKVVAENEAYGSSNLGSGETITLDFSAPNIAKPFHVGHLFGTALGNSLYKMFKFEGYNCIGINHLGDWGTQFGKLIVAYEKWSDDEALEKDPIKELLRIYVKFHDEAENDPTLVDEGRLRFKLLEEGSEKEVALWTKFKDLSLKEFNRVYDLLGIKFDSYAGESFYNDKMDTVIQDIEDKGLLTESNGAKVVMLDDYNMPPCIIKKADGATIYATRDLAAAIYRKNTYDFYKNVYVVGSPQALHFKQVFKTLELMGNSWASECKHVGYGLVKFSDKKLSTRKGDVIFLDELLGEAVLKTIDIINEKNPQLENKAEVADIVGIGAIIFTYLKNNREKDIVFDWKEMLSFDGETGPYVQYTYARGKSILKKAGNVELIADYSSITSAEEFELIKLLDGFQSAILSAIERYEPSVLTRYIIDVAKSFNKFYNLHQILNSEDEDVRNGRLLIVNATCQVIKNGLSLLGIGVVEKM